MANTKSKTFLGKLSSCFCDPWCQLCRALMQLLRLAAWEDRRAARDPEAAIFTLYVQFLCSSQEALHCAIK